MTLAIVFYIIIACLLFLQKWRQSQIIDVLPSLAWIFLMVLPFIGQKSSFDPIHTNTQAFGILLFGFAFLISDYLSGKRVHKVPLFLDEHTIIYVGYGLFTLTLGVQLCHLIMMPKIPLFDWVIGEANNPSTYAEMREHSSKLLRVPIWVQHAFQLSIVFISPLALVIFLNYRKYLLLFVLISTTLFYSYATLARWPITLFLAICIIVFFHSLPRRSRYRLGIALSILVMSIFIYAGHFLFSHPASVLNYRLSLDSFDPQRTVSPALSNEPMMRNPFTQPFTITDHHRRLGIDLNESAGSLGRAINYFVYRAVLTPVDVSHRWYIYYPDIHGSYVGFYGLTPSSRNNEKFQHPSNQVCLWAYASRFPDKYLPSCHAYASIDADAWARGGYLGLITVSLLLLIFRLMAGYFRLEGQMGDSIYVAFLVVFSFSLPIASIQALMQSQGTLYYWFILIAFLIYDRSRNHWTQKEI